MGKRPIWQLRCLHNGNFMISPFEPMSCCVLIPGLMQVKNFFNAEENSRFPPPKLDYLSPFHLNALLRLLVCCKLVSSVA